MPRRKAFAHTVTVCNGLRRPRFSRAMPMVVIAIATAAPCLSNPASATAGTTPNCLRGMPSSSHAVPVTCTRLLPLVSTTRMRLGGTEYNYQGPENRVVSLTVPSPSFNSATASPAELREAGVPPEPPRSSPEYPKWEAMIKAGIQFARPEATLEQRVEQLPAPSAGSTDPAGTPPLKQSAATTETWSGYFEWGGEGHFTKADLYYKDPANKHNSCETNGAETETSIWAGLGGNYEEAPLAQTGTLMGNSTAKGLVNEQEAWFEVPNGEPARPERYKMPLTVVPGHWVQADVQYDGHEEFSFFVEDLARHKATRTIGHGKVDANVADFIIERTAPKNLVNFGDVQMQGFTNNKPYAANPQKIQRETLVNVNGETMAKPERVPNAYEFFDKYENRCLDEAFGTGLQGDAESLPPTATTEPAESVGGSTATLKGLVNPKGQEARYSFEYGTEEYNYSESTPELSAGSGSSPVNVSRAVTGLSPGTTYHYRIIADGAGGIVAGADNTFSTTGTPPPPPPTVTTEGVSGLEGHSATLEGNVNPNGLDSHYYFEYGTTSAQYDSVAPALPGNDAGSGTTPVHISVGLTGLAPYVTYYYRVVASSSSGTSYGGQKEFKLPVAGQTKFQLNASTYFDEGEHGYGTEANAPWVKEHVGLLLGYPSYANKYIGFYHVPTFAYLDQKAEQKEHSFTNEQYVNAVEAQAAVGYAGAFVDDANWEAANEGPSQTPESIATLLEELHTKIPGLQIEINSQYHEIWPLIKAKNTYVLRALAVVNGVDKAFGVNEPAGITTKTDYEEFLKYVEYLHEHKLFTVYGGDDEKVADQEYNLATYFLVNNGSDYVSGDDQHPKGTTEPEQFWPGYGINLGVASGPKELTGLGYYTRAFENGVVYVNPPQAETRTIKLEKAMETPEGVEESSITLKAGEGAVLENGPARFGKTSVGASSDHGMFANYKIVHKATLSVSGDVTKLSVYAIPGINSPEPQALKAVIYSDSGGSPSALLATGTEVSYNGKANGTGWFDLPFGTPVALSSGTYWIGFITSTKTEGMGYRYASVANSRAYNTNTYSSGPTNPFGSATKDSEQASIYATYTPGGAPAVPVNTIPPTIAGATQQGQTLTEGHGSWLGEPTSFSYQWLQCQPLGNACLPISGATNQTYVPVEADVGHTIEVQETASNSAGAGSAGTSGPTAVIQKATATFGKTSVGSSSDTFVSDRKRVNRYALSAAGSINKLSVYLAPTGTSGQQVIEGLVYADSSGAPGALLGTSEQLTFKSANYAGWYGLSFSSPLKLAAGNYWIGVITGATSKVTGFRYDSVASSRDYNTNTYTSGPSNPFGSVITDSEQASLYATYTPE